MAEIYRVLSEYNAFHREQTNWFIRVSGNEGFIFELEAKINLIPEEGFFLGSEIEGEVVDTFITLGNEMCQDIGGPRYRKVEGIPPQKTIELKFIDSAKQIVRFLTKGRWVDDRALKQPA